MMKRVKKLVKGHKKNKDKNINTPSFTTSDHSDGDSGQGCSEVKTSSVLTPSFHVTDHSSHHDQSYNTAGDNKTMIIIPPSIEITDHSTDNDNENNNDENATANDITDNRLSSTNNNNSNNNQKVLKNQRCASSSVLSDKNTGNNNNKSSSKENKHFKKRKSSQQLHLPSEGLRQVSKSTGDLTHLLSPNRHASQPHLDQVKSSGDGSGRGSVETVRENRLSVMSKLDEYIDHFKKSVDEDKMAYAPNRLCCAQILLKVYQKREQQYIYNSLHPSGSRSSQHQPQLRRASQGQQHLLIPTNGSFHNLKSTTSTPDFTHGHKRRVSWQEGSESSTSLSDDSKNCNFSIGGGCDTSDSGSDSDGHENHDNSSTLDISRSNRPGNSLGILKGNTRQRSMPLFPHTNQDIEIY